MDAMTEIRQTFFEECAEQLCELQAGLRALGDGSGGPDTIGVVFRAVHSIKGGAASFQLKELVRFALMFEGVLNEIRSDRLAQTPELHALLGRAEVVLGDLVAVARDGEGVFRELRALVPGAEAEAETVEDETAPAETGETADFGFVPVSVDFGDMFAGGEALYRIVFTPRPELYANANESARLIRECLALGSGTVACDTSATPLLGDLAPEGAFLSWTIELTTSEGESAIREIFDFAEFDCDLDIARIEAAEAPASDDPMEGLDPEVAALFARLQATA